METRTLFTDYLDLVERVRPSDVANFNPEFMPQFQDEGIGLLPEDLKPLYVVLQLATQESEDVKETLERLLSQKDSDASVTSDTGDTVDIEAAKKKLRETRRKLQETRDLAVRKAELAVLAGHVFWGSVRYAFPEHASKKSLQIRQGWNLVYSADEDFPEDILSVHWSLEDDFDVDEDEEQLSGVGSSAEAE